MANMFANLYKTRTSTQCATTIERMEVADNLRRDSRWTALLQRRNITAFMSPINSPHVSTKKVDKSITKNKIKNDRFEQLMKWKEQKKKKMDEIKAKSKPIFKVCAVKEALRPDLNEVYSKIKGTETFKLVPSSTYKFKPPSNVKPLNMQSEHSNVKRRLNFKEDLKKDNNKSLKPSSSNTYSTKMKSYNDNSMKKGTNKTSVIKVDNNNLPKKLRVNTNSTMKKLKSPKVKMVDDIEALGSTSTNNSKRKLKNTKVEMINVPEEIISCSEQRISTNNSVKKLERPNVDGIEASGSPSTNNSKETLKNTKVEVINVPEEIISYSEWKISTNNSVKKLESPKVKMVETSGRPSINNSKKKLKNIMIEMINVAEETVPSSLQRISTNNSAKKLKSPKKTNISSVESPIQSKNIPDISRVTTPVNNITYISPFITISRGKENSRREYHERRSNFYESPTISALNKNTTPKAGAAFFENLLSKEEQRLNELCSNWEAYEDSEHPPEEASDMIRMAIGQTKLLLRKKFCKFKELISQCKCPTSDKTVTCLDLHGFWDIIMIQINNLDGRFENLMRLKCSNWEEIVPPLPNKKQQRSKKNNVKKKEVKSSLRDLIKEQRKNNFLKKSQNSPMIQVTTPRGRLLNISNTTLPQPNTITPITLRTNTPKSILKSGHSPKARSIRKTKSVLFKENLDKENMSPNLMQFSPEPSLCHYPRRSSRLAEKRINC